MKFCNNCKHCKISPLSGSYDCYRRGEPTVETRYNVIYGGDYYVCTNEPTTCEFERSYDRIRMFEGNYCGYEGKYYERKGD